MITVCPIVTRELMGPGSYALEARAGGVPAQADHKDLCASTSVPILYFPA